MLHREDPEFIWELSLGIYLVVTSSPIFTASDASTT
jgi:hypothetical protein